MPRCAAGGSEAAHRRRFPPLAAAVAVPVAYAVNFYFLPEDRTRLFRDSVFLPVGLKNRVEAFVGYATVHHPMPWAGPPAWL